LFLKNIIFFPLNFVIIDLQYARVISTHRILFKKKMTTCGEYVLLNNHIKTWFDYNDNKAKIV
jgi:hypothetical protein